MSNVVYKSEDSGNAHHASNPAMKLDRKQFKDDFERAERPLILQKNRQYEGGSGSSNDKKEEMKVSSNLFQPQTIMKMEMDTDSNHSQIKQNITVNDLMDTAKKKTVHIASTISSYSMNGSKSNSLSKRSHSQDSMALRNQAVLRPELQIMERKYNGNQINSKCGDLIQTKQQIEKGNRAVSFEPQPSVEENEMKSVPINAKMESGQKKESTVKVRNQSIFKRSMNIKQPANEKGEEFENIEIEWTQKDQNIIEKLNQNLKCIMEDSKNLKIYNNDSNKEDDMSSIGSISSADVRDLELIMSGEHTNYFQAYELIKQFEELNQKKRESIKIIDNVKGMAKFKRMLSNLSWSSIVESMKGRRRKKRQHDLLERKIKNIFLDKKDQIQNPNRKKRSGKELWKIAKKLVKAESKINLAQNILRLNREIKAQRQHEEQKIQEQKLKEEQSIVQQALNHDKNEQKQIDEDYQIKYGQWFHIVNIKRRLKQIIQKYLIEPNNRKLKYFHLLVAFCLIWDFLLTCFIMSNYRFHLGREQDFLNHSNHYVLICFIQAIDIILNFLKIEINSQKKIDDPKELFENYLKGSFITDCIAVFPYSVVKSQYIFLRYLKLIKFQTYLKYFEENLIELTQNFLSGDSIKILIQLFRLTFQIVMISHFFACLWVLLGMYLYEQSPKQGWLDYLIDEGIQGNDYMQIYTTSIYWVITTFSSVGYGDVVGKSDMERGFQLLVEMVGICFFGYMIGTFQNILHDIGGQDPLSQQQETIDYWLIKLDKTIKNRQLGSQIYTGVKNFYNNKFKFETSIVQQSEFYQQLKPKLQRQVLDFIFSNFYKSFKDVFRGCDLNFKREIFRNSTFNYLLNGQDIEDTQNRNEYYINVEDPILEQAQTMSQKVHFIISGQIHIMNKDGQYEYGILDEGSYFGDISLLLGEENEYSYFYNPFSEKPINLLQIDGDQFLSICKEYPVSMEVLTKRAIKRKRTFQNFKTMTLLSYMKTLKKSPKIITKKLILNLTLLQRVQTMKILESKLNLFEAFIKHYELHQQQKKLLHYDKKCRKGQSAHGGNSDNNNDGSAPNILGMLMKKNKEQKQLQLPQQKPLNMMNQQFVSNSANTLNLIPEENVPIQRENNQTAQSPVQAEPRSSTNPLLRKVLANKTQAIGSKQISSKHEDRTAFESDSNQSTHRNQPTQELQQNENEVVEAGEITRMEEGQDASRTPIQQNISNNDVFQNYNIIESQTQEAHGEPAQEEIKIDGVDTPQEQNLQFVQHNLIIDEGVPKIIYEENEREEQQPSIDIGNPETSIENLKLLDNHDDAKDENHDEVPDLRKPKKGWIQTIAEKEERDVMMSTENGPTVEMMIKPKKQRAISKQVIHRTKSIGAHPKKKDESGKNRKTDLFTKTKRAEFETQNMNKTEKVMVKSGLQSNRVKSANQTSAAVRNRNNQRQMFDTGNIFLPGQREKPKKNNLMAKPQDESDNQKKTVQTTIPNVAGQPFEVFESLVFDQSKNNIFEGGSEDEQSIISGNDEGAIEEQKQDEQEQIEETLDIKTPEKMPQIKTMEPSQGGESKPKLTDKEESERIRIKLLKKSPNPRMDKAHKDRQQLEDDMNDPDKIKVLIDKNQKEVKKAIKEYFDALDKKEKEKTPEEDPIIVSSESESSKSHRSCISAFEKSSVEDSNSQTQDQQENNANENNMNISNPSTVKKHLSPMEHLDLVIEEFMNVYQINNKFQSTVETKQYGNPPAMKSVQANRNSYDKVQYSTKIMDSMNEKNYEAEITKYDDIYKTALDRQLQTQCHFREVHDQGISVLMKQVNMMKTNMKAKIQILEEATAERLEKIKEMQK